jgi:hypothetical protein
MKTVHITRNALFKPLSMILCNNITTVDESFIEDNMELFYSECETCEGNGEIEKDGETVTCDECNGDGQHATEPYQYFLIDGHQFDLERLKEYGVEYGYSESLDLHVLPIYDFGTGWSAFSYSKEVDDDYELSHDETAERTTVY